MPRKLLIALLAAGTLGGYASGFAHLSWRHRHGRAPCHSDGSWDHGGWRSSRAVPPPAQVAAPAPPKAAPAPAAEPPAAPGPSAAERTPIEVNVTVNTGQQGPAPAARPEADVR